MIRDDDDYGDFTSPYYLHHSDHSCLPISPVIFNGQNYQEWEACMRHAFRAKRKLGFLDGTIPKPNESTPEFEDWDCVNATLIGWLVNSIDPTLRSTITYYDTVREVWEELRERYSVDNSPREIVVSKSQRIMQLRCKIAWCRQSGKSVADYYGRLKRLWDEFDICVPMVGCRCGNCTCGLELKLVKDREEKRVHQFLMGLDNHMFGTLCSRVFAQDEVPGINKVYSLAIQEEHLKKKKNSW